MIKTTPNTAEVTATSIKNTPTPIKALFCFSILFIIYLLFKYLHNIILFYYSPADVIIAIIKGIKIISNGSKIVIAILNFDFGMLLSTFPV